MYLIKYFYRLRDHCKNMEEGLTKASNIVAHVTVLRSQMNNAVIPVKKLGRRTRRKDGPLQILI
uniref:Uncharacterized protein n=1 Tax=Arundo donax TaxID=35708 RepID=A0A0A9CUE4_ARUDO